MITGRFRYPPAAAACLALALAFWCPAGLASDPEATESYVYADASLENGRYLRNWLLCGPFPNPVAGGGERRHDRTCSGFFTDYLAPIGGETGAAAQDRLEVPAPDGNYRQWSAIESPSDRIYFDDYLSPSADQTGYAVCWIEAGEARNRLFSVGSSDGVRIWVNGEEIFRNHAARSITPDEYYVRLPLQRGRNQILVKIDNGAGRWGFMMRPVENKFAMNEVIDRLRKVLRFDYRALESEFELTFGDPAVIGNIEDLPNATVSLIDPAGERVHTFETDLARPVRLPFDAFPEKHYTLEGEMRWPWRGRVVVPGMLYRGDPQAELQSLLASAPPDMPESRARAAYRDLHATVARLVDRGAYTDEPYALRRLKAGMTAATERAIALQNSASPYDRLFPAPRQYGTSSHETVRITGNWTLNVADSLFDDGLDRALFERWSQHTGALAGQTAAQVHVFALETSGGTPPPELEGTDAEFRVHARAVEEFVPEDPEGYAIQLTAGGVTVAGRTAAGAFYGLDTLLQLVGQAAPAEDETLVLDAGTIIDAPVYRTRAAVHPLESFDETFEAHIDQLARLRYNTVFLPSSLYPDLDDAEIQPMLVGAYAYCRARFIEPIPLVETFGADTLAARIDPNLWEGVYHEALPVTVDHLRRLHLPYDRILESNGNRPRLRTGEGYKILRKGRDYEFASHAPPVIQLTGQAPVQTGETVLVSADLVDRSIAATRASCPSDTEAWLITERVLERIYTHLAPRGVHLGQRGAGYLNRDSRCLNRELPNALILADALQKGYDIVRKLDRKAEIFLWGDHFNPLQRARALDAVKAPQHLPRDITVLDGHYHSASYYDVWRVEQGIQYFDQFGFNTLGTVRDEPLNVVQYAAMKPAHPRRFRGIVYRPENSDDGGAYVAAEAGWEGTTVLGAVTP